MAFLMCLPKVECLNLLCGGSDPVCLSLSHLTITANCVLWERCQYWMSFSSFQVGDAGSASWVGSCSFCCYWKTVLKLDVGPLPTRPCRAHLFAASLSSPSFPIYSSSCFCSKHHQTYLSLIRNICPQCVHSWRKQFSSASNTNAIYSLTSNGEFLKCFTGNNRAAL